MNYYDLSQIQDAPEPPSRPDSAFNQMGSYLLSDDLKNASGRDRSSSYATQINVLPSLALSPSYITTPVNAPPGKGLGPAPVLPTTVQQRRPTTQQFVVLNPENDGYWAVQQAVRSVGNVAEWHSDNNIGQNSSGNNGYIPQYSADGASQQQEQQQVQQHNQNPPIIPNEQQQPQYQPEYEYQMDANGNYFLSYANYGGSTSPTTWIDPSLQVTAPLPQAVNPPPPQALYQPPGAISQPLHAHALKQPPGVYTEDPVVVRANIMEFNAMAQMHSDDAVPYSDGGAQYTSSQSAAPTHNDELGTVNEMMDIQLSQTEGSNIWTGHQQEMFGTATAQPVVSMDIHMVNTSGKVRFGPCKHERALFFYFVKTPPTHLSSLYFIFGNTIRNVALKDVVIWLLSSAPTVSDTVATVNVNEKGAINARRAQPDFVSLMEVAVDAPFQDVTKVHVTSFFVPRKYNDNFTLSNNLIHSCRLTCLSHIAANIDTVVENAASLEDAPSQLWAGRVFVRVTVEGADVKWRDVTNLLSHPPVFVSNMAAERNASTKAVKKFLVGEQCIALQ